MKSDIVPYFFAGVFKDKTLPDVIVDLKGVTSLATVKVSVQ